jgi:glycerol-3-phosphate acyltransferase PlsX
MNIAVDAMGGDNAPERVVQGAVQAASELGVHITLVGNDGIVGKELWSHSGSDHISIHHCEEMIGMGESPLKAVRQKKDASIRVAFDLIKKGQVDAVVSAGNSGATLAAGAGGWGRKTGHSRNFSR